MTTTSERLASGEQTRGLAEGTTRYDTLERTLNESLRRMMDSTRPDGIFGAVVEREGIALIPCAEVTANFGLGGGSGFGPTNTKPAKSAQESAGTADQSPITSSGGGVGGGGGVRGRPVAVIVVSQGKARVLPVVDVTRFMLAAMTTAGIIAFLVGQTLLSRRGQKQDGLSAGRLARALRGPLSRSA